MRWSLLVSFALTACGASGNRGFSQQAVFGSSVEGIERPHREVLGLPIIARLNGGSTSMVIRGRLPPDMAALVARTTQATYNDINARFIPKTTRVSQRAVDVCVFATNDEYRAFVRDMYGEEAPFAHGFYLASHRMVAADLSVGLGNLRHELVHPLIRDAFPTIPDWLNEALASLYGGARYHRGRYRFVVDFRLDHLRSAMRQGTAPGFVDLALSDYHTVHGPRERAFYASGRYLLLYLDRRGRLVRFVREMATVEPTTSHQLNVLRRHARERSYWRWVRRLPAAD